MSTNLPHSYPSCGVEGVREELAAMIAKAKCPCEKFERLLAAAKDATACFIPVEEMYRRLRILTAIVTAIEKEAK